MRLYTNLNITLQKYSFCILLFLGLSSVSTWAEDLNKAHQIEKSIIEESIKSQHQVSKSSDAAIQLKEEIKILEIEISNLSRYQQHLKQIVVDQQKEISSIDQQLIEVKDTKKSIVPLMYQMLDWLEQFVLSDKPINKTVRVNRISKLKAMMSESEVSDAEKYRQILDAYQLEVDYGVKLGVTMGVIEVSGQQRETEQLNLGRLALVARSLDKETYWAWDAIENNWATLDLQWKKELEEAYSVAVNKSQPSILTLPISIGEDL